MGKMEIKMKKVMLNAIVPFIFFIACFGFFLFLVVLSSKTSFLAAMSFATLFMIPCLGIVFGVFELIIINEQTITSIKAFKKTKIIIKEIVDIQEKNVALRCACDDFCMTWEIVDSNGNVINLIKKKRRQKIIDYLKRNLA